MTKSNTAPILSKLADCLRIGGGPFSGAGQYAALVAMYPFITYFSLFDFVPEVAQPQVFEIVAQAAGGSEGAQAMAERTAYQVNAILAFFFTGYIPAILRCLWRRAWGWLFIGMIAAHFTLLDLAADFGVVDFGALRATSDTSPGDVHLAKQKTRTVAPFHERNRFGQIDEMEVPSLGDATQKISQ